MHRLYVQVRTVRCPYPPNQTKRAPDPFTEQQGGKENKAMKLIPWKTRKQRVIEHWNVMAEHYDAMADEKARSADVIRLSVHFRAVAALYRFNAIELGSRK